MKKNYTKGPTNWESLQAFVLGIMAAFGTATNWSMDFKMFSIYGFSQVIVCERKKVRGRERLLREFWLY